MDVYGRIWPPISLPLDPVARNDLDRPLPNTDFGAIRHAGGELSDKGKPGGSHRGCHTDRYGMILRLQD
jgi:hypothetical protein